MNLTETCIRKPVLAWMLMAATVVFGGVAIGRIGISQFPDVDFPVISVDLSWEGAAPEVMENDVVELVEESLSQVEGIQSITSTAQQGRATVSVELDISRNIDVALQDVQTRVAQAQERLPTDMDPPVIEKRNPEDRPIMWVGLSGTVPPQVLADTARYVVKERLQRVAGVGEVMMGGYLERNVRIWVDARKLDERGLTVADVIAALHREHVELPAGRIEAGGREVNVRVLGEAVDLAELRGIVIREAAGKPIELQDVALVEDGFEDARRRARVNGVPAQGLGIKKQRGANAVAVARAVRSALADLRGGLPAGVDLGINFDSTVFIEESVRDIEIELLLAVLLTALVCWMFLGSLQSTLNVVLAIPMSLLGTIAIIYFLGFTLNTFTLLALALAVGIVVDDAIMVMENIFRHGESGKDRVTAAREGTREITFAALAATLAVVAIFVPVVFMKGLLGRFFLQFGVTLALAVLLSYVEAVTLAPARCAQFLQTGRAGRGALGRLVDRALDRLAVGYGRALGWSLRRPWRVLALSLLVLAAAVQTFRSIEAEFVPSQDQSRMMVRMQTAVGSSLDETDGLFRQAEAIVNGRRDVRRAFAVVGGSGRGVNNGIMFLTLVPKDQRRLSQAEVSAELRMRLSAIPGLRAVIQDLSQAGFTAQRGFPVEFSLRGADWDRLVASSAVVTRKLAGTGLVVDLDTDYEVGMPELQIVPLRERSADVGVSMDDVATTVNALVGGVRVGKYSAGARRIDVRLRLLAAQRTSERDLGRLRVRSDNGTLVPLSTLVRADERPVLQAITRRERQRAISVFANVAPGHSQEEAVAAVEKITRGLPDGVRAVLGGSSQAFRDSFSSLLFALVLGIVVAYMILAGQFNSFLHPITVLTVLPLSAAGAAFALWISGLTLNVFSMIGLLLLMGIAKKNSIILVDFAAERRRAGRSAVAAMAEAGPVRLRPILMTSIATMMAALPSALGIGSGGEVRRPMSLAVIGGILVSTLLSLFVVPAFYVAADGIRERLAGRLRARRERRRMLGARPVS